MSKIISSTWRSNKSWIFCIRWEITTATKKNNHLKFACSFWRVQFLTTVTLCVLFLCKNGDREEKNEISFVSPLLVYLLFHCWNFKFARKMWRQIWRKHWRLQSFYRQNCSLLVYIPVSGLTSFFFLSTESHRVLSQLNIRN